MELLVSEHSVAPGRSIIELKLPAGALVVAIYRGDESLTPSGVTVLEAGDRVLFLADRELLPQIRAVMLRGDGE